MKIQIRPLLNSQGAVVGEVLDLAGPGKTQAPNQSPQWHEAFSTALLGECLNSDDPVRCAIEAADKATTATVRGGPGSGHFAHEGRPGEVGGSTPGVGQGMTADWTPDYLGKFRAAVEGGLRNEKTYVPSTRALNGWMIGPDGRTFEVGFGNHDTAFADALMHASIEQPFQGWRKAMDEAEIPENLPDKVLDRMTDLMYDAGFIAVDEHTDRTGEGPVILAFKGRAPQTMAQRRAIKDMVLSGDTAPEFEFKTPSGDYMGGDTLWKFEQAVGISMRGGPGSGHFGHEGRPGERGGSLPGEGGTAKEAGTAEGVARIYRRTAEAVEPRVTSLMQRLAADNGGTLHGLDSRLKREESLARKIAREAADKGLSLEEAATDIVDALRYTMLFEPDGFVDDVLQVQQQLEAEGWKPYDSRATNYFRPGDAYDGYNTSYINADGQKFELQFHTPETATVKEEAHTYYEQWRSLPASDSATRTSLWSKMTGLWDAIQRPVGWEQLPGVVM